MKSWYLIHTKPRQERLAREHLDRQGYETYLPLTPIRRRRRGNTVNIVDPMFPRYLFIRLSETTDDWRPIRSTIGVSRLVVFGNLPARVPDVLIDTLKKREDQAGVLPLIERTFLHGERVRIAAGPMEGLEGILHCNTGKGRVILLLEIARNHIKLEIAASEIESI